MAARHRHTLNAIVMTSHLSCHYYFAEEYVKCSDAIVAALFGSGLWENHDSTMC